MEQLGWDEELRDWHSVPWTLDGSLGLSGVGSNAFFPGQKIRLLTPVRLGTCGECRREAGQDLPGIVVQGSSTCPTEVM